MKYLLYPIQTRPDSKDPVYPVPSYTFCLVLSKETAQEALTEQRSDLDYLAQLHWKDNIKSLSLYSSIPFKLYSEKVIMQVLKDSDFNDEMLGGNDPFDFINEDIPIPVDLPFGAFENYKEGFPSEDVSSDIKYIRLFPSIPECSPISAEYQGYFSWGAFSFNFSLVAETLEKFIEDEYEF
ncbi:MAG: hypothetical protein ACTSQA_01210 [Candidatus Heimdallarchaeaceae archaeon]